MFGDTYKTVLTLDANDMPTAIASTAKEEMIAGTISGITSNFTKDTVVTGLGRTLGVAASHYAVAVGINKQLTGNFNWNPLKNA